jgi:hypothetical protein
VTVIVTPGLTVQVFEDPVKFRLPETALVPVAFKVKLPVPFTKERLLEMFKAPVKSAPYLKSLPPSDELVPDMVRFPVPAFALT